MMATDVIGCQRQHAYDRALQLQQLASQQQQQQQQQQQVAASTTTTSRPQSPTPSTSNISSSLSQNVSPSLSPAIQSPQQRQSPVAMLTRKRSSARSKQGSPPHISVEDSDMPWLGESDPITWDCCRVALMGLDGAGKTSLLCAELAGPGSTGMAAPTLDTDAELVTVKRKSLFGHGPSTKFAVIDFSGDKEHRSAWQTYSRCGTLVLYVVDSTKPERMKEAAAHLRQLVLERSSKDKAAGRFLHFCVLANKQDLPGALRPAEVAARLRVSELPCFEKVFGVSATTKHPLRNILRDLMAEKKLTSSPE